MRGLSVAALLLAACSSSPKSTPQTTGTFTFSLDAGAFPPLPDMPSVLVYVPAGFVAKKPVHVVVWLHGHDNCVQNVVRDDDGECYPGRGTRSAHHLAAQLDASMRNALLVVPEVRIDSPDSDPGNLTQPGGMRALLAETLADMQPALGPLTVDDLAPLVLAAHSSGYDPAAAILAHGGLPVAEVWHLDSLYGDIDAFVDWVMPRLDAFAAEPPACRFTDVYTHEWGTEENSLNFADTVEHDWLPDAGAVYDDRSDEPVGDDELRHGFVFKLSSLSHDDVARVWFERFLSTSPMLPGRPAPSPPPAQ